MITVISRFRVANQKSVEVEEAFRDRPRLVESAAGFRSIEVSRDTADPTIFYLCTKWDNLPHYQSWHSSPAHHASHTHIPKGLKLDPSYTRIEILNDDVPAEPELTGIFLHDFLSESDQIFYLQLDQRAILQSCSPSFCSALRISSELMIGKPITEFLVESDALALPGLLKAGNGSNDFILNFVGSDLCPIGVRARVFLQTKGSLLIAERNSAEEGDLGRQLIDVNNELTRLMREIQQKNRELTIARDDLARALEERDKSYWYIRKLHDVLPICMGCKKVKSSDAPWEDIEEFLKKNTDFLSHGFCPECLDKWKADNL